MEGTLGFLGCGALGRALLSGWLKTGRASPDRVLVAARTSAAETSARLGVSAVAASVVAAEADVVVLAVKPSQVPDTLQGLSFRPGQLLISVVAGVSRARIAALAAPARVVRTMPNVACRVGQGATLVLGGAPDAAADVQRAVALFEALGHVEVLTDEKLFHAATALVGSGPAYLFLAIEALADGAVAAGLPRAQAQRLAAHTVLGAGRLAVEPGAHPAALKDAVASPGGTTIEALAVLERRGFRGALLDAVRAAAERSRELESAHETHGAPDPAAGNTRQAYARSGRAEETG